MPTLEIGASVPPQIITSARPSLIASSPSPIAMFEAAHAVHSESSGPFVPSSMETQPAARFGMIWTIENGLTRSGPRELSVSTHASNDFSPPMPVATAAPTRSGVFGDVETRVGLRLPRGRQREVREPVHPARSSVVDPLRRVEVGRLAGEGDREIARVELCDRSRA